MPRVKMFCDWDRTPYDLMHILKRQTAGFERDGFNFHGVEFVDHEPYDHAVIFNYGTPSDSVRTPPGKNIGLVLEPPEISEWMHPLAIRQIGMARVAKENYYSFAQDGGLKWAPGIGFATARLDLDGMKPREEREFGVCMIVSNKLMTQYHNKRREVLDALLRTDLPIHFYGRGMERSSDERVRGEIPSMSKDTVLHQYGVCIDFENSPTGVLTDKFFDPVLCGTVPITNAIFLNDMDVPREYISIDFNDTVDTIVDQIAAGIEAAQTMPPISDGALLTEVSCGKLSLAKWIYDRIMEL